MSLNICLVEPEIPFNTGAIARSCGLSHTRLHLVRPLGFSTDDKHLKRSGLDYWHLVDIQYYDSIEEVQDKYPSSTFYYASTKAKKKYCDVQFHDEDFIVFGKETKGLPEPLIQANQETSIRIPMLKDFGRSLNLANSALKQLDFPDMD